MKEIGIVCIHGAGLNSTIWNDFRQALDVDVLPIDFPNRYSEGHVNKLLTFADYVEHLTAQINEWEKKSFIILAHSIGALLALKAAEHFKERLKGFATIASIVPISGGSFVSTLPFPQRYVLPVLMRLFGTKPPEGSVKSSLCNDLNEAQTQQIIAQFTPEAKSLYTTKISFSLPEVKKLYIQTTMDEIDEKLQMKMAQNLKADKVVSIPSGHMPMLSKPRELADIILDFMKELE